MRALTATFVALGLGVFFATGCGSSTPSGTTGGTTGTATTGASTTGGSGSTTTGGTSGLPAGSPCTGNNQCSSDQCGINGMGNCCTALCSTSDATCGASACDGAGACTYPVTGTSCGAATCSSGMLTASACDGSGSCAAGTPTACPNNLGCNGAGNACLTICAANADCDTGFYCNGGTCAAQIASGSACTSNASCTSTVCGIAGTGNCCTAACNSADLVCGATACDTTGTCTYPVVGMACGTATCSGGMLTTSACDGSGNCAAGTPSACPDNLACNSAGTVCLTTCAVQSDCVTGFYCVGGTCTAQQATGACTENDACTSGVCGTTGSGFCCTAACLATGTCGATACDGTTGACNYPVTGTACGTTTCSGTTLTARACNGTGTCMSNGGVTCPNNLTCNTGGTACNTTCAANSDCAGTSTNFCDTSTGGCCPAIAASTNMFMDSTTGSDATACCGYGTAGACQTLTRAMGLVDGTNTLNPGTAITLVPSVNGREGDWPSNIETYPISLGWGVTLSAPGIYFTDTGGIAGEIFDIALQPGENPPGAMVTIQGNSGFPIPPNSVVIGSDSQANLTADVNSIQVEANETLNLSYAFVYEASGNNGINIQSGATLDLDQGSAGGALELGGDLNNGAAITANMGTGILCNGTVTDSASAASSSLVAQAQNISIDAEDGCSINLVVFPKFGTASSGGYSNGEGVAAGGNGCGTYPPPDSYGIWANGNGAIVTLEGAEFSCMTNSAIHVSWTNDVGVPPMVTLGTDVNGHVPLIENCSASGIFANAGTVTVNSGLITHNFIGVDMETDNNNNSPTVTLNDGTMTNNTTVICDSNQELNSTGTGNPGIDVYNNSTGNLAADYVNWDQWYTPSGEVIATTDLFWCDNSTFACTCEVFDSTSAAACQNMGTDDYDLVLGTSGGNNPTGTQSSANGAQAANHCN